MSPLLRGCTDILCCILFILALFGYFAVGILGTISPTFLQFVLFYCSDMWGLRLIHLAESCFYYFETCCTTLLLYNVVCSCLAVPIFKHPNNIHSLKINIVFCKPLKNMIAVVFCKLHVWIITNEVTQKQHESPHRHEAKKTISWLEKSFMMSIIFCLRWRSLWSARHFGLKIIYVTKTQCSVFLLSLSANLFP